MKKYNKIFNEKITSIKKVLDFIEKGYSIEYNYSIAGVSAYARLIKNNDFNTVEEIDNTVFKKMIDKKIIIYDDKNSGKYVQDTKVYKLNKEK